MTRKKKSTDTIKIKPRRHDLRAGDSIVVIGPSPRNFSATAWTKLPEEYYCGMFNLEGCTGIIARAEWLYPINPHNWLQSLGPKQKVIDDENSLIEDYFKVFLEGEFTQLIPFLKEEIMRISYQLCL